MNKCSCAHAQNSAGSCRDCPPSVRWLCCSSGSLRKDLLSRSCSCVSPGSFSSVSWDSFLFHQRVVGGRSIRPGEAHLHSGWLAGWNLDRQSLCSEFPLTFTGFTKLPSQGSLQELGHIKNYMGLNSALTNDLMCTCRRARHRLCISSPWLTRSDGDTYLALAEGLSFFYFLTALEPQN